MHEANQRILRFSIFERVEHFVLVLSFTTLAVTGLPQKYALFPFSQAVIGFLGGIETTRIIHHRGGHLPPGSRIPHRDGWL
jgi:cytochrome b subunit of formate dehydrogenase